MNFTITEKDREVLKRMHMKARLQTEKDLKNAEKYDCRQYAQNQTQNIIDFQDFINKIYKMDN